MSQRPPSPSDSAVGRLAREYLARHARSLGLAGICMVISALGTAALAYVLDPLIRVIFLEKKSEWLIALPFGVMVIAVIGAVAGYTATVVMGGVGHRVVADLQRRMAFRLIRADLPSQEAEHSAAQVSRFTYDVTLVRDMVTRGITAVAKDVPTVILLIGLMIWQDWSLALIVVIFLPIGSMAIRVAHRYARAATQASMRETGALSSVIAEAVAGRRVIKAYNLETAATERAEASIERRLASLLAGQRAAASTSPISEALGGIAIAFVVGYAGWRGLEGELPLSAFMSFLAAVLMAFQPIRSISGVTALLAQGSVALQRVYAAIDEQPVVANRPEATDLPAEAIKVPSQPIIRFENVSFAYGDVPTLTDVSFDVPPGATVALVGPSGAGKSTVMNLLLQFHRPSSGRILVGGHDITAVRLESVRDMMALVTQDAFLFDDTIAANIAHGAKDATQAQIEHAARSAAAHDFIMAMPAGYATRVGEVGSRLSGGQRQRIAIARALLRDAPILLLDEATSALDAENEAKVQEAVHRLMEGRTTITIAHRLSTILNADMILAMEHGRIAEQGTHADLLARDGLYARLFRTQFAAPGP